MRLSCSATQFALLRNSVSLPMTCCSELFEIRSGDEIKTMRAETVPGVAVAAPVFSTDTASANGPFGSESCFWGCCRFVLPQLWSDDCASGVTVKPPCDAPG